VGVIISVKASGKVEAAFLTKNRIEVSASNIALLYILFYYSIYLPLYL
jgi:hypothetical protein